MKKLRIAQAANAHGGKEIKQPKIPDQGGFVEFNDEPKQKPKPSAQKEYSLGLQDTVEEVGTGFSLPPSISENNKEVLKKRNRRIKDNEDSEKFNKVVKKLKTNVDEQKRTHKLDNTYYNLSSGEEEAMPDISFKDKVNQLKDVWGQLSNANKFDIDPLQNFNKKDMRKTETGQVQNPKKHKKRNIPMKPLRNMTMK